MSKRLRLTFPSDISADVTDWLFYVDSNIFPEVDKENSDPSSTSLSLQTIGEMRHRGQALLTILRNRLENKRRESTISSIETSAQVEQDILRIQAVFDFFRNEINQMPEALHKVSLHRTLTNIVKRSNARMIPAAALDLENLRANNLDRIRQRRSSFSSDRVDEENRGTLKLF